MKEIPSLLPYKAIIHLNHTTVLDAITSDVFLILPTFPPISILGKYTSLPTPAKAQRLLPVTNTARTGCSGFKSRHGHAGFFFPLHVASIYWAGCFAVIYL